MIRLSQIDSDCSIYKNNTVVLYTKDSVNPELLKVLEYHKIKAEYICDTNKDNWGEIQHNIPVISPQHLEYMVKNNNQKLGGGGRFLVQIATENLDVNVIENISSFGIDKIISFGEADKILHVMSFLSLYQSDPLNPYFSFQNNKKNNNDKNKHNQKNNKRLVHNILNTDEITPIFIAQTQKTGDMTLKSTFIKNNIPNYFTNHDPHFFDKNLFKDKTIKITTAIRDPIAKTISNMYQIISSSSYENLYNNIKNDESFFANGGNIQLFFDKILETKSSGHHFNASIFMDKFSDNIIDLSKHPFDKEKGYTIVKEGNIEVFVYQLEKMNDIVKEMSDWIGQTPFDKWEMANEASNKWIADSYNQAKKELKFSQEYFDKCYNDKWLHHFYSHEDIEKFKEHWRPQIKK